MKYIKGFLLLIVSSLIFSSCDDFLTTDPESQYSEEGAYKTQADFEYAITGVYAKQQELYGGISDWFWVMNERSDDIRYFSNMQYHHYGVFTDGDDEAYARTFWADFWTIISRSNFILDRIDVKTFNDSEAKNNIKGEALALRAWAYYSLAWQYGGMPLIDNSKLSIDEVKKIARSTQKETFDFAEKDFLAAIDLLPTEWTGDNSGRVTKYAAMGVLSRMYMFMGEYSKAKPYLASIVNSGLYQMAPKYEDCFNDKYDNNPSYDRLWYVQFTGGELGEGQSLSGRLLYGDGGGLLPYAANNEASQVSQDMVAAYEEGDLRKDQSIVTGLARSGVVDDVYYYVRKFAAYTYVPKSESDWANNIPIIRYTDVIMMLSEVLNEEGYVADGEAFQLLNKVRTRAGLPLLTSAEVVDQTAFRNAIIKERQVEFAFEGLRWYDLIRFGIAESVMNKHFAEVDEGSGSFSMDGEYRKLFAIPFDEITRYNDESIMWQNPGY